MSLLDCITRFSTAAADGTPAGYVVTRTPIGTYPNGRYVPGTPTTFLMDASIQPYGGELDVLPEGIMQRDIRVIYSALELKMAPNPDTLVIRGETFAVMNVDGPFSMSNVTTWRSFAARQTVP
jgi:hypothetical protein